MLSYNVMKRLADRGHQVTWYTSLYPGAEPESTEGGITYLRAGTYRSIHYHARSYLKSLPNREEPNVIIDEVNTRPFDPSRFVQHQIRVINWVHQLAREVWFYEVPFPIAVLGRYLLEDHWLRRISKHTTMALSNSTAEDLTKLNFRDVRIVPPAIDFAEYRENVSRINPPSLLYIGRLSKGKRVEDALKAYSLVRRKIPTSMIVLGRGPVYNNLVRRFPNVTFPGYLTESEKSRIISQATLLLVPGTREGWGLVVLEAQARGVVPIVYNVPGLRDAVGHGKAGILLNSNTPESMADAVLDILANKERLMSMSQACRDWASHFTYERTTNMVESILLDRYVGD